MRSNSKANFKKKQDAKRSYWSIAESTKKLTRMYLIKYAPETYLIEGQGGGHYSASSIRKF